MEIQNLKSYPDESRIWVYGFNKVLSPTEKGRVESQLEEFVRQWKSHGKPVNGTTAILEDTFLVFIVSPESFVSGCSIDSSVGVLKLLRDSHGLDALDRSHVYYRGHDWISVVRREEFEILVKTGKITADTNVFDTTIQTLGQLRSGKFEILFQNSWHSELAKPNSR